MSQYIHFMTHFHMINRTTVSESFLPFQNIFRSVWKFSHDEKQNIILEIKQF